MSSRFRRLSAAIALTGFSVAPVEAATYMWQGGCGSNNWYDVCTGSVCAPNQVLHRNNWYIETCGPTGMTFPGALDAAIIGGTAYLDRNAATVQTLQLDGAGSLAIRDGGQLTVGGVSIVNNGMISMQWGGWAGDGTLTISSDAALSGNGEILSGGGVINGAGELRVMSDQTIHGRALAIHTRLNNEGLLSADEPGTIQLATNAKSNSGTMEAINGGTLSILTQISQSSTGKIRSAGGAVQLHEGARVVGGRMESTGESTCLLARETATLENCENYGKLIVEDGATLALVGGTFRNEGQIQVRYGGWAGNANLRLDSSPVRFISNGEILFSGGRLHGGDYELSAAHTLRGGGADIQSHGTNFGLIHADTPGSITLSAASTVNRGVIQASGGGSISVLGAIDQFVDEGRIVADNGAVHFGAGSAVSGGALETANGGTIRIGRSSMSMTNVTNRGTFQDVDGAIVRLNGSLTNEGVFHVAYGGWAGDAFVVFETDSLPIYGAGEMVLAGAHLISASEQTFRNTALHTIRGRGSLTAPFENEGLILADVAGSTIKLDGGAKRNLGIIRCGTGSLMELSTALTQESAGRLIADGGTIDLFNGSRIIGGTLETPNNGLIRAARNTAELEAITNDGDLRVGDGGTFVVRSSLTNHGQITVYYGGWAGNGHVQLDGTVLLNGSGMLTLEAGDVTSANGGALENGAGHTLRGGGPIHVALTNAGIVAPGVGIGAMTINATYVQQPNGVLEIEVAGPTVFDKLQVNGAALVGGAVHMKPTGGFRPTAGQQFTVLSSSGLSGSIAGVLGPGRYGVANVGNEVVVTVLNGIGDTNCDGFVTVGDISAFVTALIDPEEYVQDYPSCEIDTADVNADGFVTVGDIGAFVTMLTGS